MHTVSADNLRCHVFDQLSTQNSTQASVQFLIALSGGLDSCVLLHILSSLATKLAPGLVRAIHVNHGVSDQADYWAEFCDKLCLSNNIPLIISRHDLSAIVSNREAVYRQYRYETFKSQLKPAGILLTAHHQGDQTETLLFNLFRGTGISGLSAMKALTVFTHGYHLRPFLSVSRAVLEQYASKHKLNWIEDPSNQDTSFDRNYIRQELIPVITRRWPSAVKSISRSADLVRQAEEVLRELAEQDIKNCLAADFPGVIRNAYISVLNLNKLKSFSQGRQHNMLKHWLEINTNFKPSAKQLARIYHDLCSTDKAKGLFESSGIQIRAFSNYLFLMQQLPDAPADLKQALKRGKSYNFFDVQIKLEVSSLLDKKHHFRLRKGGEIIRHNNQTQTLKKLFVQHKVPPWERLMIPLLFEAQTLVAVPGVQYADNFPANEFILSRIVKNIE